MNRGGIVYYTRYIVRLVAVRRRRRRYYSFDSPFVIQRTHAGQLDPAADALAQSKMAFLRRIGKHPHLEQRPVILMGLTSQNEAGLGVRRKATRQIVDDSIVV